MLQQINVGNAQRQTINFKTDPEVHNMARSYLNFEFEVDGKANNANYIHKNCLSFIEQIQYYSQNGSTYLVDVNYLNNYTNVVWPVETKLEDFLTNNKTQMFYREDLLDQKDHKDITTPGKRSDSTRKNNLSLEPVYFESAAIGANANVNVKCSIPLSAIKNTLLALDKDIYFTVIMNLKITLGPGAKIAYRTNALNNPSGTDYAVPPVFTKADVNTNLIFSNVSLDLAQEQKSCYKRFYS